MCGGGGKAAHDNSAQIAREEEAVRQKRILEGQENIDSKLIGFNDEFYNKYNTDYTGYYFPQLDNQYDDARKRLTLGLAKTGNLNSSAGINQIGDLLSYYNNQKTGIINQGLNATNKLRADVDNMKSQLYSDNRSAADPGNAAAAAAAAATQLQPSLPQNPLANAFAEYFNSIGSAAAVYGKNSNNSGLNNNGGVKNYYNSGSSSRVIQ